MVVALICGGGNGAHVAAGIAAAQDGVESRVLTLYADEAERWNKAMEEDFAIKVHQKNAENIVLKQKPSLITKDPAEAMPGVDIIVLMVPAFAHEQYLNAVKPFLLPGMVLAGCPGQAGFEFAIRGILGDMAKKISYMSFESLPWACRIAEYGKCAEVLGTKDSLTGAVQLSTPAPERDPTAILQQVLGPKPELITKGHVLGITLMEVNGYVHPSILYGFWSKWDGKPLSEPPLFYQGIDQESADVMSGMSQEVLNISHTLMNQQPGVDLNNVKHIFEWYLDCYSKDMKDTSTLYTAIKTNAPYDGLTHPCIKTDDGKYLPNYKHRYLAEDIPFGLLVIRGIGEILGVPTPTIDEVLDWCQKQMGKEYLKDGKVAGSDVKDTRTPQKYNLETINDILGL